MNNLISTDAEVLLAIKENEKFCLCNNAIEVILSQVYLTFNNLNSSLNRLLSAGLIDIIDDSIFLTDKAKVITCGYLYNKRDVFLEKLKNEFSTIIFTDYINKNCISIERYKIALKISKKANNKANDNRTLLTETLSYLCYVLIMFFLGFAIDFILGGNVLGGLFTVPVAMLISLVLYIKTKSKIKSQKSSFDVFSLIKKPVIISIIVNALVAVFSIFAFIIWDVSYFIALIIEIIIISVLWVYTSAIAKDKIAKGKYKSKFFCAKIYTDSYFIGGVNILDENERVLQENVCVSLINPETNNIIFETFDVYKTVVKGRQIFYATIVNGESRLIYFLRKIDVLSAVYLIDEVDFILSANCEKAFLMELVKNVDKTFDCKYSQDDLVRAYSCIVEGKNTVIIEYFDYSTNESSFTEYKSFLTDELLCNPYFKPSWNRVLSESFNDKEYALEFLNKIISEVTYENLVVNLFNKLN